jgi:hypothetical protein
MAIKTKRLRLAVRAGTARHESTVDIVARFLTIMVLSAALTFVVGAALLSRS